MGRRGRNEDRRRSLRLPLFHTHLHFTECDSTMTCAERLLETGEIAPGAVITTDHQSAGAGTHGRRWSDAPGSSLLVTMVLPTPSITIPFNLVPLALGLSLCDVLGGFGVAGVQLKWPNDALIGDRKLSGVLCRQVRGALLAGVGVNVRSAPAGAISVAEALHGPDAAEPGGSPSPEELLEPLLLAVARRLSGEGDAAAAIVAGCNARLWRIGRRIEVDLPGGEVKCGTLVGISGEGALELRDDRSGGGSVFRLYAGRIRL